MDTNTTALEGARPDTGRVVQVLGRMFRDYTGCFAVRLWNGETITLGHGTPRATLVFHTARAFRDMVLRRDWLRLAEAHFLGELEVEGDFFDMVRQRAHLASVTPTLGDGIALFAAALRIGGDVARRDGAARNDILAQWRNALRWQFLHKPSKDDYREAISFHYDVSNDFYRLWLDQDMVYSCAYFNDGHDTLDQAQQAKLDLICRKLRLTPGERLLDIGCGWGALVCWAARHYGVFAHGITLSRQQYDFARARIANMRLEGRVMVELRDYRDLPADSKFDKVASVGMFEHVGIRNFPSYFGTVRRVLKPGGLFLNHGITNDEEGWRNHVSAEFSQRYVFPEGELETVSNVQRAMERENLEILDVESLRAHYSMTLRHWVRRLEAQRERAVALVGEPAYRVWRLYMTAAALEFERGGTGLYQILAANRRDGLADVPLTREDLYQPHFGDDIPA